MNSRDHIVRSYDKELRSLDKLVMKMGGLAESQLQAALACLNQFDRKGAEAVVARDVQIDEMEHETEETAFRVLALRHPIADDLRYVIGVLKICGHLERVGDHTKNFAKRVADLSARPEADIVEGIARLGRLVGTMLTDVIDAFAGKDASKAIGVWNRDKDVDELHSSILRMIVASMARDSETVTDGAHLLFMVRNLERVGDFATNIAEVVRFQLQGVMTTEARPKSDDTTLD